MNAARADQPRRGLSGLSVEQRRHFVRITVIAIAVFCGLRWLPTGTNLSHMDFRVDAKNSIEFCDPLNPQFIPVVAVASPIALALRTVTPAAAGRPVDAVVTLQTASEKPIAPEDLLVVHTKRLHLLLIDPSLRDYQHVHPEPGRRRGEWRFTFTPKFGGTYRVFADFTPVATARGLYANTEISVAGVPAQNGERPVTLRTVEQDGYRFELEPGAPIRARQPTDLTFKVTRVDGAAVPLGLVMGAYAHLVAFDEQRSGFAHLHPTAADPSLAPDRVHPTLNFKITIPTAGRFVIWAQVDVGGREVFVPFWFDVAA
jgi:hypothetical protein